MTAPSNERCNELDAEARELMSYRGYSNNEVMYLAMSLLQLCLMNNQVQEVMNDE